MRPVYLHFLGHSYDFGLFSIQRVAAVNDMRKNTGRGVPPEGMQAGAPRGMRDGAPAPYGAHGRHAAFAQEGPGATEAMPSVPPKGVEGGFARGGSASRYAAGMEPAAYRPDAGRAPRKKAKVAAVTAGAVVLLLVCVYVAGAVAFMGRFYPDTVLGSLDVSLKSADEAAAMLAEAERDYTLRITGQGLDFSVTSEQAGVGVDARSIVEAALGDANPWLWPVQAFASHDESDRLKAASDSTELSAVVAEAVDAFNASATPASDAHVAFDDASGAYVVAKEVYGTQISPDAVAEAASTAIASMQDTAVLGEDVLIKPSVLSDDARLAAAAEKANVMIGCDVVLTASTNGAEISELDGSVISGWISFDENLEPSLDEGAMDAWAQNLAASLDTVGTARSYTRPDGKQVSASGGDYGWKVDSAALISSVKDAVANGTVGELQVPCSSTGNGYTASGQDWGAYCDVDLTEQHAYYYDASGELLWDSGIVSGKPNGEDDTPTGVYYLKNLQTDVSLKGPIDPETNEPEWDSPVDYWMPFVGNMVGLHDAPWQPSSVFGNAEAYKTYGSHGCVNLPSDKAAALFGIIQIGDPVIVHW